MSAIPCHFKDKCNKKDCPYSHEQPRPAGVNSKLCQYGKKCRTKNCTFTHLEPPEGATATRSNCRADVNCSRVGCSFNHPNGRLIDHSTTSSSNTTQQNTASNSMVSLSPRSDNRSHQRRDSAQSGGSSRSHSRASSSASNTRTRNCHFGTKCKRSDCHFEHPNGKDIDRVPTTAIKTRSNTAHNAQHQQLSNDEVIETINKLLSKAQEELQEFDVNDKTDDEQVLDVLEENALKELGLQKNEFQSAINCLMKKFTFTLSSTTSNSYDVLQFQRIQKQLERELKRWQSRLPIYARRSDIIEKIKTNQVLILKADTGSGKSTQTVQYLCDEHFADQSK
jgi:hypothetical protein